MTFEVLGKLSVFKQKDIIKNFERYRGYVLDRAVSKGKMDEDKQKYFMR